MGHLYHAYLKSKLLRVEFAEKSKLISAAFHSYPQIIEEIDFETKIQKVFKPGKTLRYSLNQILRAFTGAYGGEFPVNTSVLPRRKFPLKPLKELLQVPFQESISLLGWESPLGKPFELLRVAPDTFRLNHPISTSKTHTLWNGQQLEVDERTGQVAKSVSIREKVTAAGRIETIERQGLMRQGEEPSRPTRETPRRIRPSRKRDDDEMAQAPTGKLSLLRYMKRMLGIKRKRLTKGQRRALQQNPTPQAAKPKFVPQYFPPRFSPN